MSDLVDLYNEDGVRVWLRLDDDCRGDLDIRLVRGPRIGTPPGWFTEECSSSGLDMVLHAQWRPDTRDDRAVWAIERGLCPGQPFLVAIDPPRWYRCSYEYEEYDVEWTWDILDVVPRTPARAARAWAGFFERRGGHILDQEMRRHEQRRLAATDRAAMYVFRTMYWSRSYGPPDGHIVRLTSRHGDLGIEGRATGKGARKLAFEEMLRRAGLALPHLDPDFIRSLPVRW